MPNAAPLNITATAVSANWLNMTWLGIKEEKRNGIILSYIVKYKRTDGKGAQYQIIAYEKNALLQGLAAYEKYDISVAGVTSKGHGIFSSKVTFRTLESGKALKISALFMTILVSLALVATKGMVLWDMKENFTTMFCSSSIKIFYGADVFTELQQENSTKFPWAECYNEFSQKGNP